MFINRLIILVLTLLLAGPLWAVSAQEEEGTPTPELTTVEVGHGAYRLEVPVQEPLVLWAAEEIITPNGQFAKVVVVIQDADGTWQTLTPCDDIAVTCEPTLMRIDGVSQGDQFYLDAGEE